MIIIYYQCQPGLTYCHSWWLMSILDFWQSFSCCGYDNVSWTYGTHIMALGSPLWRLWNTPRLFEERNPPSNQTEMIIERNTNHHWEYTPLWIELFVVTGYPSYCQTSEANLWDPAFLSPCWLIIGSGTRVTNKMIGIPCWYHSICCFQS